MPELCYTCTVYVVIAKPVYTLAVAIRSPWIYARDITDSHGRFAPSE